MLGVRLTRVRGVPRAGEALRFGYLPDDAHDHQLFTACSTS